MRYFLFILFTTATLSTFAQVSTADGASTDSEEEVITTGRPDVPGDLFFNFGYNIVPNDNNYFSIFGSESIGFYYHFNFPIGDTKFSFNPGIGYSSDRYKLSDSLDTNRPYRIFTNSESAFIELDPNLSIQKSMLVSHYVEVPLEFRFSTNPGSSTKGFNVAIGGKAGYLFRGMSKIKYQQDNQTKRLKDIQKFHMTDLRYGAYLRVGTNGFGFFAQYMATPIFKSGEGPTENDLNTLTVGFSFNTL